MNETFLDTKNIHNLIKYWRKEEKNSEGITDKLIARCYIDAYQTVLVNHSLPKLEK